MGTGSLSAHKRATGLGYVVGIRIVALAALCTVAANAGAQDGGPSVEVYSSGNTGSGGAVDPAVRAALWRLPVAVSVNLGVGYDDNPGTVEGGADSFYTSGSINLGYNFGTERTRGSLSASTGMTYYPDLPGDQYDPNVNFHLSVSHPVSLRMNLAGNFSLSYRSEPDFSTDLSTDRRADHFYTSNSLSMSYQWLPRISTVTSYSFGMAIFEEEVFDSQDRIEHSFGQSFRFLYLPVTTLALDYGLGWVSYSNDGRNSYTHSVLVGADHTFSEKLSGSVRAGVGFRTVEGDFDDGHDGLNPHLTASLSYALTGKASLSWNASYATEESYLGGSSGSLTFRTGLVASYAITPRLSSSVAAYYVRRDDRIEFFAISPSGIILVNDSFIEESFDISVGLNYTLNRFLSANAGYSHTEVESDLLLRGYSRSRYFGGLSINF